MKKAIYRWLIGGVTLLFFALGFLILNDQWETAISLLVVVALLLPGALLAISSRFVSLKLIAVTAILTQMITLPHFFLGKQFPSFPAHIGFDYTAAETFSIILPVGFYQIFLVLSFYLISEIPFFSVRRLRVDAGELFRINYSQYLSSNAKINSVHYGILIFLIVLAFIPVKLWMFSKGIGMTGIEPPALPFRLSGGLHYLTNFLLPLLLGFIYYKSNRGPLIIMMITFYALVSGLSSISRSAFIFCLLPIFFFAMIERKKMILLLLSLFMLYGYSLITHSRSIVYDVAGNKSQVINSYSIYDYLISLFAEYQFLNFEELYKVIADLADRIEGFSNLVRSFYYDPYAVLSPIEFVIRCVWQPLVPINIDAHHLMWQGYLLPEGFYNGGALLSLVRIVANGNYAYVALLAFVSAVMLLLMESSLQRISKKYKIPDFITYFLVTFMALIFFTATGGAIIYFIPLVFFVLVRLIPKVQYNFRGRSRLN